MAFYKIGADTEDCGGCPRCCPSRSLRGRKTLSAERQQELTLGTSGTDKSRLAYGANLLVAHGDFGLNDGIRSMHGTAG
jgi:hypothetical protein